MFCVPMLDGESSPAGPSIMPQIFRRRKTFLTFQRENFTEGGGGARHPPLSLKNFLPFSH